MFSGVCMGSVTMFSYTFYSFCMLTFVMLALLKHDAIHLTDSEPDKDWQLN